MPNKTQPVTIIIFGASGDLSKKKLLPALLDLYAGGFLPEVFNIVGFSRKTWNHDDFRGFIKEAIEQKKTSHKKELILEFISRAYFCKGDLDDLETYHSLSKTLAEIDNKTGLCASKILYLSVSPAAYEAVFNNISKSGLALTCAAGDENNQSAWTRVLVEKPFGNNLNEARKLDRLLGELFLEEQIFRIDHYLAKETIQNILSFRFSNSLFEPIWNNKYIEKVEIRLIEENVVGDRGASYDAVGALRDVGQNHLLQMLALVAMENPDSLDAELIRKSRADLLAGARFNFNCEKVSDCAIKGQYEGYASELGVAPDSGTETYFKVKVEMDNDRFRGTPFYLESGKGFESSHSEIAVYFKETASRFFAAERAEVAKDGSMHKNILTFSLQPKEGISLLFWAKRPGFGFDLEKKLLSFSYKESGEAVKIPDAYERVLFDCVRGDQTLFASTEEVMAEWRLIMDVLSVWEKIPLQKYQNGIDYNSPRLFKS